MQLSRDGLPDSSDTPPSRRGRGTSLLLIRVEVQTPSVVSTVTAKEEHSLTPSRGRSLGSPLTSSDSTLPQSLGCHAVAPQHYKSRLPARPFLVQAGLPFFFCDAV